MRGWVVAARITIALAALLEIGCASHVPPVPDVAVNGLDTDVRNAIETALKQAVAEPKSAQASGRLGMVLEAHQLFDPAVLAYRRAVLLDPKEFNWHYYLALSLQQPEQALPAIDDALHIRPDYAPAILKRGELLYKLGRFKESEAALQPLLARDPNSAAALYQLARVKYSEEDFAAAEDLYRRACQAYPTYGAALYGLAETGKRLGHAEAAANFELAELNKNDTPPADDPALREVEGLATGIENRLTTAKQMIHRKDFEGAAKLYKEVLKQYPDNPDCLVNLLYLAQFPGQASPDEVEAYYARARELKPPLPQVYMYYGTALASQGRYDAAVASINKAIAMKPDFPEAHAWLADVMERQNRPDQAVAQYRKALEIQPSLRPARLELAKLLLNGGRSREAIPALLPALDVNDSMTPVFMMFLAQAYVNTGDYQKAKDSLRQARVRLAKDGPSNLLEQVDRGLAQLGTRP
jgi:tetratricopeptide (TPR) repeat protein